MPLKQTNQSKLCQDRKDCFIYESANYDLLSFLLMSEFINKK